MKDYNNDITNMRENIKHKPSNKINRMKLNTEKKYNVVLIEMQIREPLSYIEKLFQVLILNIERKRLSKIIQKNSQFYNNEINILESKLNKASLEEIKECDEYPLPSVKDDHGNISAYSSYLSDSQSKSNSFSQGYSSSEDYVYANNDPINNSAEIFDPSNTLKSTIASGQMNIKRSILYQNNKERRKSQFNKKLEAFKNSSKTVVPEIQRNPSNKYMPRYDQEVISSGFIRGSNTVPLVSELLARSERNNNILEVYERFKFFVIQCLYHSDNNYEMKYLRILKEIDLYLKSYEDENENSDWDSDGECVAITIAKNLKSAIEEKTNLTNELSSVEIDLVAANSNNSREILNSSKTHSEDYNNPLTSPNLRQTFSTDITLTKKPTENSIALDNKDNSLYKNVLSKGSSTSSPNKGQTKCESLIIEKTFSEAIDDPNNSPNIPVLAKKNASNTLRLPRRFASSSSFNQRSSSIRSIKSSKITSDKKRDIKKKSGYFEYAKKKSKEICKTDSGSNESSKSKSKTQRSHSQVKSDKLEHKFDEDPKFGKGLSSFAKVKQIKNKKRILKKVQKIKSKISSKNQSIIEAMKIYSEHQPNPPKNLNKGKPHELALQLHTTKLAPKSQVMNKMSNKKINKQE